MAAFGESARLLSPRDAVEVSDVRPNVCAKKSKILT